MISINLKNLHNVINDDFYPLLSNKNRNLVIYGGAGSGKSFLCAQKIILRILVGMSKGKKHRILALRKTIPAVRKSIFILIKDVISEWNLSNLVKINKTEMTFYWQGGSEIICMGLDDPEKIKSIHGVTSVWMEEATEFTAEDFNQLNLRLRGSNTDYFQILLSFNPISQNNWVYKEFFENTKSNTTTHHSTYKSNRYIDSIYKQQLEDFIKTSAYHYKVYTKGEFGVLEGLVYDNWKTTSAMPSSGFIYGVDFGYSNSSTAIVKLAIVKDDMFIREELYRKKMTNADLSIWMQNNLEPGVYVYADSAEPARIAEIARTGVRIRPANKGKNSVLNGIDFVSRHNIYIEENSTNLIKEISGYIWRTTNNQTVDAPVKIDDHALDAARYAAYTHWGKTQTELRVLWI